MAFIKCVKCKRPISDQSRECKYCRTPISGEASAADGKRTILLIITVLAVSGLLLAAYLAGLAPIGQPPAAEPRPPQTPAARVDTRFGLTEAQRRDVYQDLTRAEDHAQIEADRRYPPLDTLAPDARWQERAEMREHFRKQADEEDRKAVAKRYELTREQLQAISAEGIEKSWPRPPRRSIR